MFGRYINEDIRCHLLSSVATSFQCVLSPVRKHQRRLPISTGFVNTLSLDRTNAGAAQELTVALSFAALFAALFANAVFANAVKAPTPKQHDKRIYSSALHSQEQALQRCAYENLGWSCGVWQLYIDKN
jgi:hypothetical protein